MGNIPEQLESKISLVHEPVHLLPHEISILRDAALLDWLTADQTKAALVSVAHQYLQDKQ